MSIEAAEGFIDLGMYLEAWEAVEELDIDKRVTPRAMHVRLHCSLHFEKWDMAETLATLLAHGDEGDRLVAANAFQMLAVISCRVGELDRAKEFVRKAIAARPEIKLGILDDPLLSELLL